MKKFMTAASLCCCLAIIGCNNQNNMTEENQNRSNLIQVKNTVPQTTERHTAGEISRHLVELTSHVPNVKDATAIVVGQYAIVGIDVGDKMDRAEVSSIKYTVAESLKNDPYGANAVVFADPDTFTRLQHIGNEVRNGRPITGFLDELAAIVNRVMPEIAEEIRQNPSPTETNDNKLSGEQQHQLNEQQEKQSKNNLNKNDSR